MSGSAGVSGSAIWQDTRFPQKIHTENIKIKTGRGGRFLGPEKMFRRRIYVSQADPDKGREKGVRGILLFMGCSFHRQRMLPIHVAGPNLYPPPS